MTENAALVPALSAVSSPPSGEDEALLTLLANVVASVGSALPPNIEIVLHDLAKLPNSIVAVSGDVTHRSVGDPATDVLLRAVVSGTADTMSGYETQLDDGRQMRSSTLIVRNASNAQIAALCVNADISSWIMLRDLASASINPSYSPSQPTQARAPGVSAGPGGEKFVTDVDELAAHLVREAIASADVPVSLMKKKHKLGVVAELRARGMFLLRDAVEMVSTSLDVSRFTIYNYLNELEDEAPAEVAVAE